jgi:hypothetical protein
MDLDSNWHLETWFESVGKLPHWCAQNWVLVRCLKEAKWWMNEKKINLQMIPISNLEFWGFEVMYEN